MQTWLHENFGPAVHFVWAAHNGTHIDRPVLERSVKGVGGDLSVLTQPRASWVDPESLANAIVHGNDGSELGSFTPLRSRRAPPDGHPPAQDADAVAQALVRVWHWLPRAGPHAAALAAAPDPSRSAPVRPEAPAPDAARAPIDVKTLVWLSGDDPVVVVLGVRDRVNKQALALHLGLTAASNLRLAPPELAEALTGFKVGGIPPAFHLSPMQTVVDKALAARPGAAIDCGERAGARLQLHVAELLAMPHVGVGDVRVSPGELSVDDLPEPAPPGAGAEADACPAPGDALPYFGVDLPPWSRHGPPQPIAVQRITFVARTTSLRRLAKKLCFASCDPVGSAAPPPADAGAADVPKLTWRNVQDGRPMAVQLIFGKTVVAALGEDAGIAALRGLRPGQTLLVEGVAGSNREWGQRNWQQHRCCDVLVRSFQVMSEDPPATASDRQQPPATASNRSLAPPEAAPLSTTAAEPSDVLSSGGRGEGPFLSLADVYAEGTDFGPDGDEAVQPQVVDDADGVAALAAAVATAAAEAEGAVGEAEADPAAMAAHCWGFDAEWKPTRLSNGGESPVALLQLASRRHCFLVDLQTLAAPHKVPGAALSPTEAALDAALAALLHEQRLIKVGFAGAGDLRRLAASFPHLPAFQEAKTVLDLATLSRAVLQGTPRAALASLSKLTAACLGRPLDKAEQCSDWTRRPLTDRQREYAALDAAVCARCLRVLAGGSTVVAPPHPTHFARVFPRHLSHWRFILVADEAEARRVKAKAVHFAPAPTADDPHPPAGAAGVSVWVVSQSWQSSSRSPSPPSALGASGTFIDKTGDLRVAAADLSTAEAVAQALETAAPATAADGTAEATCEAEIGAASEDGQSAGAALLRLGAGTSPSKERVLEALVPRAVRDAPPPPPLAASPDAAAEAAPASGRARVRVEFNPRSGLVECEDAVVLFVNVDRLTAATRYPNAWADEGRRLSFFVRGPQWRGGTTELAQRLLGRVPGHAVLLFARNGRRRHAPFVFCGRCVVEPPEPEPGASADDGGGGAQGSVGLRLQLLDFAALEAAPAFVELVAIQRPDAASPGSSPASTPRSTSPEAPPDAPAAGLAEDGVAFQTSLARLVNGGDVVGAMQAALEAAGTRPQRRSMETGLGCLKSALARSQDPEVAQAVDALDQAAERLGLF